MEDISKVPEKLCVISMSGGLDSSTLARKAIEDGYIVLPLNFNYGQKNAIEQTAFKSIFAEYKARFPNKILEPVNVDLTKVMEESIKLYENMRDIGKMKNETEMEFYTPSRNLVFSTLAAMIGEIAAFSSNLTEVKIGIGIHKHTQYDRDYWDITPEFVSKLNDLFALNDCMKVSLYAPYAEVTKDEIVKDAIRLHVPISKTWTCYEPQKTELASSEIYKPCLKCEACIEREAAGKEAGLSAYKINDYSVVLFPTAN